MLTKLMTHLAEIDKREKLYLLEYFDNRMMREIRQFNYENRTTFDAVDTFLDYLASDFCDYD
jgi:hypothetical protein